MVTLFFILSQMQFLVLALWVILVKNFQTKQKIQKYKINGLTKKGLEELNQKGYLINNIDVNIITQTPKIKKFKKKIIDNIAKLCEVSKDQINTKKVKQQKS